ncbi:hypothetical protein HK102_005458 [Quaeritorhiza haematococci]|nr:hypothetical protein HK102_005458 [Quaeritorhiza haematococci]
MAIAQMSFQKINWEMKQHKIPRAKKSASASISLQAQQQKQQHQERNLVKKKQEGGMGGARDAGMVVEKVEKPAAGLEPSIRKVVLMQNLLTTAQKKYAENLNQWRLRAYMMEVQMQRNAAAVAAAAAAAAAAATSNSMSTQEVMMQQQHQQWVNNNNTSTATTTPSPAPVFGSTSEPLPNSWATHGSPITSPKIKRRYSVAGIVHPNHNTPATESMTSHMQGWQPFVHNINEHETSSAPIPAAAPNGNASAFARRHSIAPAGGVFNNNVHSHYGNGNQHQQAKPFGNRRMSVAVGASDFGGFNNLNAPGAMGQRQCYVW